MTGRSGKRARTKNHSTSSSRPPTDDSRPSSSSRGRSSRTQPSSSPEFPRFRTPECQSLYDRLVSKRSVMVEREVVLDDFAESFLPVIFRTRGWEGILALSGSVSVELVREFYSNVFDIDFESLSFKVTIRGHTVFISPDRIAQFLHIPRVPNALYPHLAGEHPEVPPLDLVASSLCGAPRAWVGKNLAHKDLTQDYRMLHHIMCSNIDPRIHTSEIGRERAQFLHAIGVGEPIDLPAHIAQLLIAASQSQSSNHGLPFGILISRLLGVGTVLPDPGGVRMTSKSPLGKGSLSRSVSHAPPPEPANEDLPNIPEISDPAAASSSQPSSSQSISLEFLASQLERVLAQQASFSVFADEMRGSLGILHTSVRELRYEVAEIRTMVELNDNDDVVIVD